MDASLDLSRWTAAPRGVGYRRWTIVSSGLRQLLRLRVFKILLAVAWAAGVALAALGFVFSQAVATGGWLESLAVYGGPRAQAFVSALAAVVLLYPDVCIGGWYTLIFWAHSFVALGVSLIALTTVIPRLITRDRASNALLVYLCRPITSTDYLLGKLGIIVGVLVLVWTGPLLFGWVLSVALAPNTDFIVHSFAPLMRALWFNGVTLVTLAAIALGVSALSRKSASTVVVWIGLWLVMWVVTAPPKAPVWMKRASFARDITEVQRGIFELDSALLTAGEVLPLTDKGLQRNLRGAGTWAKTDDFQGALASLAAFIALSSVVFLRRLKPE